MEKEFNAIKKFILETLPSYVEQTETTDTPMPAVNEKAIVLGTVDITKYKNNVVVSVLADSQEEVEAQYIGTRRYETAFTLTFIFSGNKYSVLVRQMARYASALREAILKNRELEDGMRISELGTRTFHNDIGTTEKDMTAFELNMTITTETNNHK